MWYLQKMHALVERGLRLTNLYDYIDYIVGSDDVVNHKPHPRTDSKSTKLILNQVMLFMSVTIQTISNPEKTAGIKTIAVNYSLLKEALKEEKKLLIMSIH